MSLWKPVVALVLFLMPSRVFAGPPDAGTPAPSSAGSSALIYGGGKTREDAQRWLDDWKSTAAIVPALTLAAGFPKLMKSDDVAGLKPGFFVVLLGYCGADEVEAALAAAKTMYAGAYVRPISVASASCPVAAKDFEDGATVTLPDRSSIHHVTLPPEEGAKDPDASGTLLFVLRGPDGLLRDSTGVQDRWHLSDTPHTACSASAGAEKGRFVVDNHCESGGYRSFVKVTAGKLEVVDEKHPPLEQYDQ